VNQKQPHCPPSTIMSTTWRQYKAAGAEAVILRMWELLSSRMTHKAQHAARESRIMWGQPW
jgi:hypothetical protein